MGQTDGQTDDGHQRLMPHPIGVGHNIIIIIIITITACCYTIPLCLRTARSNGHSDNFLLIFFSNPLHP